MRSIGAISKGTALAALATAAIVAATTVSASAAQTRLAHYQTTPTTTTTSWSPVGTLTPAHTLFTNTGLVLWGAYEFDPFGPGVVVFNQHLMPASIPQVVVPYILVPDGNLHTYRLQFHVKTDGTTTTQYQLSDTNGYQSTKTVADGDTTVEFTVPVQFSGAGWEYVVLKNLSGDNWIFYSCQIDEQTG